MTQYLNNTLGSILKTRCITNQTIFCWVPISYENLQNFACAKKKLIYIVCTAIIFILNGRSCIFLTLYKLFAKTVVLCFVCLFCFFTSQVNSYGHCGTVSSPNHTFSWASLNKQVLVLKETKSATTNIFQKYLFSF